MRAFAELIDRLIYTRSRNSKLALIADYLRQTPDPDRGWALAALTGDLDLKTVKSSQIKAMADERFDPLLFRMSRDYVGDTAETVALMWPEPVGGVSAEDDLSVSTIIDLLADTSRAKALQLLAGLMDRLDANGRYALLKLASGGMRVGVSARLAKTAVAQAFQLNCCARICDFSE